MFARRPGTVAPPAMRVLFAITRGEIGGAQEHVRILGSGLIDRGHDVGIVVEAPSNLGDRLSERGAMVIPWSSIERNVDPFADVRARRELRHAVAEFRPDVLHLHSAKAGVLGRGLVGDGATIYTNHHAPYGPGRQWSHRIIARPAEQLSLRWLDGIISVGARDMPLIRKMAPRVPLRLIRNAVPFEGEPASPVDPVPAALWVARMRRPKDPLQAVAAWEHVVRAVPDAKLIMCGEGPLADALRRRIDRSFARSSIEYLGRVPELREQQSRASLFLLTTDVEGGITMATLEAMTHGLVPVVSDAGDAWLHDVHGMGVAVPQDSPKTVAAAVVQLLRRPDDIAAMRARAIEYARNGWSVDHMVDATSGFYSEVRGRR